MNHLKLKRIRVFLVDEVKVNVAKTYTLIPIIRQKVKPNSIVYIDTWLSYNALGVSEFKHYSINHSELFATETNHINGIENFWNQAKRDMLKFNGIPKVSFHLF